MNLAWQDQNKNSVQLSWETPLNNGGSMITGYIIERCEDGTDKWLRCNARLCPDLFYKVDHRGPRPGGGVSTGVEPSRTPVEWKLRW